MEQPQLAESLDQVELVAVELEQNQTQVQQELEQLHWWWWRRCWWRRWCWSSSKGGGGGSGVVI